MTKINSIKTSNGSVHKIDEGIGFPSDKYIDLELKESNSVYIAPANGWFVINKKAEAAGQYVHMGSGRLTVQSRSYKSGDYIVTYIPVSKGSQVGVQYSLTGETRFFSFVYAQGSEPEE